MSRACGGSDMPQRNRNNIPDHLRAMPVLGMNDDLWIEFVD